MSRSWEEARGAGADPLANVRAAWSRLEAPAPPEALEDCDAQTRRAVGWARDAWARVHARPADTPSAWESFQRELEHAARASARRARLRRLGSSAAAAAAVAAAVLLLLRVAPRLAHHPRPGPNALDSSTETRVARHEPSYESVHEPVHPRFRPDGSVELRSGAVRLILIPAESAE